MNENPFLNIDSAWDQLTDLEKEIIRKKVRKIKPKSRFSTSITFEEILKWKNSFKRNQDCADFLGVDVRSLQNYMKSQKVPNYIQRIIELDLEIHALTDLAGEGELAMEPTINEMQTKIKELVRTNNPGIAAIKFKKWLNYRIEPTRIRVFPNSNPKGEPIMKFYINQGRFSSTIREYGQFNDAAEAAENLQIEMGEITLIWTTFHNDEPITNIKKFKLREIPPFPGPA